MARARIIPLTPWKQAAREYVAAVHAGLPHDVGLADRACQIARVWRRQGRRAPDRRFDVGASRRVRVETW